MKNQSYHRHRTRIQGSPELDFRQLRDRTVNALNNLGRQKFSDEPGGYSLESWARGFGAILAILSVSSTSTGAFNSKSFPNSAAATRFFSIPG
ncbi:MAG: hypothetical protein JRM74_05400 [Nitrososphaerota archaeon]|nr:hypothetical protein [Nitrososphaerota archaeon]MDG6982874.1 hypothetical protein [Nitrososphaerota archaeon]